MLSSFLQIHLSLVIEFQNGMCLFNFEIARGFYSGSRIINKYIDR